MWPTLDAAQVSCPYCGAPLTLLIAGSAGAQRYVEDCQVCCSPMVVHVEASVPPMVRVAHEDDA